MCIAPILSRMRAWRMPSFAVGWSSPHDMLPTPDVRWSFALVAALLTITPGLDAALTLRSRCARRSPPRHAGD